MHPQIDPTEGGGLSPFEINRLARRGQEDTEQIQRGIERTARVPGEIRQLTNFGINVELVEGGISNVQIIKADGIQVHVMVNPTVRRLLLRHLQAHEDGAPPANGAGGAVELGG